jgi:formate/nitrite transporter FocA (FNT family)
MEEAGAASPTLEGGEQRQAAKHAPLRAMVIHEILREQGQEELKRGAGALLLSGLAAGLSMGFSYLGLAWIRAALPEAPWAHLIASFGYTLGFVIVVLGRQQLFTESTLTAVLPVLTKRDGSTLGAMLRLWGLVLAANLVGTWAFAAVLTLPDLFRPEVATALQATAAEALAQPFLTTFVRAVFAGWLIALMVWLLPSARSAQVLIIGLMTYTVALGRLSHIVAGSSEAAYAVLTGAAPWGAYLSVFAAPTLLGNIVGGVSLVALLNHAPLREELDA